jgi:hypothetical protein
MDKIMHLGFDNDDFDKIFDCDIEAYNTEHGEVKVNLDNADINDVRTDFLDGILDMRIALNLKGELNPEIKYDMTQEEFGIFGKGDEENVLISGIYNDITGEISSYDNPTADFIESGMYNINSKEDRHNFVKRCVEKLAAKYNRERAGFKGEVSTTDYALNVVAYLRDVELHDLRGWGEPRGIVEENRIEICEILEYANFLCGKKNITDHRNTLGMCEVNNLLDDKYSEVRITDGNVKKNIADALKKCEALLALDNYNGLMDVCHSLFTKCMPTHINLQGKPVSIYNPDTTARLIGKFDNVNIPGVTDDDKVIEEQARFNKVDDDIWGSNFDDVSIETEWARVIPGSKQGTTILGIEMADGVRKVYYRYYKEWEAYVGVTELHYEDEKFKFKVNGCLEEISPVQVYLYNYNC